MTGSLSPVLVLCTCGYAKTYRTCLAAAQSAILHHLASTHLDIDIIPLRADIELKEIRDIGLGSLGGGGVDPYEGPFSEDQPERDPEDNPEDN